jgi:ubiquinone/menaquinone biosynthesis C-methylase UbiE
MQIAPQIADQIDLSGKSRLLDLGGGPGTYAIHFCKANPALHAVIYDRPTTESFARQTVAQFGLIERIDFEAGDFNSDPIADGSYDVAWLSHILHSNSLEQCYKIIRKCVSVMRKGGLIFIHDFILNDNKDGPEFPALFSLNMLLADNGGRAYSQKEIFDMLENSGVRQPKRHSFKAKNDSSIIYGIVE